MRAAWNFRRRAGSLWSICRQRTEGRSVPTDESRWSAQGFPDLDPPDGWGRAVLPFSPVAAWCAPQRRARRQHLSHRVDTNVPTTEMARHKIAASNSKRLHENRGRPVESLKLIFKRPVVTVKNRTLSCCRQRSCRVKVRHYTPSRELMAHTHTLLCSSFSSVRRVSLHLPMQMHLLLSSGRPSYFRMVFCSFHFLPIFLLAQIL